MIRLSLATLFGLMVAVVVAWKLGGTLGGGVMAGFALGAGMSGLGALYQRHAMLYRPETVFAAVGISFLAKLAALLLGALAFRYIEAAAARADWRSFLVAFTAAVVIVLPMGVIDAANVKRNSQGGGGQAGNDAKGSGPKRSDAQEDRVQATNPQRTASSDRLEPTEA